MPREPQGGGSSFARSFADVEIRIFRSQVEGDETRYPVELRVNGEQEFPRGHLTPVQGIVPWSYDVGPQTDGERLFGWLFSDPKLSGAWAEIRGSHPLRRIRLRLDEEAPELHVIPWELLREPALGGLALDLAASDASPFSRYSDLASPPGGPILQRPIKILVAISNPAVLPAGLQPIDVLAEFSAIEAAIGDCDVQLVQLPQPCTLAAIESELRKGYHVLHFIGHGQYLPRQHRTQLVIENPAEPGKPYVDGDAFAEMLRRQLAGQVQYDDKLRLVFLSSCETAVSSPAEAYRGLARILVQAGVPSVVAMQDLVPVATARAFTGGFYRALLAHGFIDLAVNQARSKVLSDQLRGPQIPVLCMRLRSGELLGTRGRVSTADSESDFWPFLVNFAHKGLCIPFIGRRVCSHLLPDASALARTLADRYGYPLHDREDLARVAQFIATRDAGTLREEYLALLADGARSRLKALGLRPDDADREQFDAGGLAAVTRLIRWAERASAIQENEVHHLLAQLGLPLYITTGHDPFMVAALNHPNAVERRRGKLARQVGPRWERNEAGGEKYALLPPPSRDEPVVFHLNGYDGDPDQADRLVLSEDDHLEHLLRLSRDQEFILPSNLLGDVAQKSFLFVGYDLGDWEFRVLLRGLIKTIAQGTRFRRFHVGVQLEASQAANLQASRDYLERYLGEFKINIYWGTPRQFITDLHARWQARADR